MLEKTKAAIMAEVTKTVVFVDPAPKQGSGIVRVVKALKEDVKGMLKPKKESPS